MLEILKFFAENREFSFGVSVVFLLTLSCLTWFILVLCGKIKL